MAICSCVLVAICNVLLAMKLTFKFVKILSLFRTVLRASQKRCSNSNQNVFKLKTRIIQISRLGKVVIGRDLPVFVAASRT